MSLNVVWLNGMPRSGTSWLSQIFDSHPDVRFRLAPLFSYRFKNFLNEESSSTACDTFIREVYNEKGDEFLEQLKRKQEGYYPIFNYKKDAPSFLVVKDTRYHNLTPMLISNVSNMKLIHIVRHPCAAINSWLKSPKEFPPTDDANKYWRNGLNRKTGIAEFWGFDDWIKLTTYYERLEAENPQQVMIVRYEELVSKTLEIVKAMFKFAGLESVPEQTIFFINESKNSKSTNEYSVYRGKNNVLDKWKLELPSSIIHDIHNSLLGTQLEKYLK